MRVLLSKKDKKKLFEWLKEENKCSSLKDLSIKLKIPFKTLSDWCYLDKRYFPIDIVTPRFMKNIIDIQEDNWGRKKGGKETYKKIIEKYGFEEIIKRRINGAKRLNEKRLIKEKAFKINLEDPRFLEFYGILLGDGWIGKYIYKNNVYRTIGISGHFTLDREFFKYCKENINKLFDRNAYLKEKPKYNGIELQFSHKALCEILRKKLKFPLGRKIDLKINDKIYSLGFYKVRYVIRGIFDTDGSFYLDKAPNNKPYPCISIMMKSPKLIKQINDILIKEDFKVNYRRDRDMIVLKGNKQLRKWMETIGSSNPKHLNKIRACSSAWIEHSYLEK